MKRQKIKKLVRGTTQAISFTQLNEEINLEKYNQAWKEGSPSGRGEEYEDQQNVSKTQNVHALTVDLTKQLGLTPQKLKLRVVSNFKNIEEKFQYSTKKKGNTRAN